jgi:hypothetical protein
LNASQSYSPTVTGGSSVIDSDSPASALASDPDSDADGSPVAESEPPLDHSSESSVTIAPLFVSSLKKGSAGIEA